MLWYYEFIAQSDGSLHWTDRLFCGRCQVFVHTDLISRCNSFLNSLIEPYVNRSWAQTNWILARVWKVKKFLSSLKVFSILWSEEQNDKDGI